MEKTDCLGSTVKCCAIWYDSGKFSIGLDRSVSDEECWQALNKANLSEDVAAFSDRLDTPVGERGKLLSDGQKQRLQIARAYMKNAAILILDEATANLDGDAEYEINQSLKHLLDDRIVIVIAHRLSTVVDADQIEHHQVTGCGRHEELIESHETYARFVQEQMI